MRLLSSTAVVLALLLALFTAQPLAAEDHLAIVVPKKAAPPLQAAARVLAAQCEQLFDAKVTTAQSAPKEASHLLLLGGPKENPAVKQAVGAAWPETSDQTLVLKSFKDEGRQGLVLGGGSPQAAFAAGQEFVHRNGVRQLLREDIFPAEKQPLKLDGYDVVLEPVFKTRAWQLLGEGPIDTSSWSLADHQKLLVQLAKLKFNQVNLHIEAWQPFLDYKIGDIQKTSATLWGDEEYRVDGDTPGRTAFGGARTFQNADLAQAKTYEEKIAAGQKLIRGIIQSAHDLGMKATISIAPTELPKEFAPLLKDVKSEKRHGGLTIGPAASDQSAKDVWHPISTAKLKSAIETYPALDAVILRLQNQVDNDVLDPPRSAKVDKESFAFVVDRGHLIETASASPGVFRGFSEDEYPPHILVDASQTAYKLSESVAQWNELGTEKTERQLLLPLADRSVGLLQQSSTARLGELVSELRKRKWDGFVARPLGLWEQDQAAYFLSRAAYDPDVTPRSAHQELFVGITGKPAAADRLWQGFQHLEQAGELIEDLNLTLVAGGENSFSQWNTAQPLPERWDDLVEHSTQAIIEFYRSRGAADPRSRSRLFYYAKRAEFVGEYLAAIKAAREAAVAKKAGDLETAVEKQEAAVESLHNALDTLGDVAEDPSDRALIAVLAKHNYRPLVEEFYKTLDAAEQ